MTNNIIENLAVRAASSVFEAYEDYQRQFGRNTRRAKRRFEDRDWHGLQRDGAERLALYGRIVSEIGAEVRNLLGSLCREKPVWAAMRSAYAQAIASRPDLELAETFFNSVTRRLFDTVGVDPRIEFLFSNFDVLAPAHDSPTITHVVGRSLADTMDLLLQSCAFRAPFADRTGDARRMALALERERGSAGNSAPIEEIETLRPLFFRGKGAYLVGRIRCGAHLLPLVIALHHGDAGIFADAVLLTADAVSILFSFTRSYFHVDVPHPAETIAFLKSIMPRKPIAELYTAIGFNKHGKTELYRDLMGHIGLTTEKFEIARGDKGMVMIVFDLPSFDVVFKVIRDRFDYPKVTTRQQVMSKYELVFRHDRAGRLADVQEFEFLSFARDRFSPQLLHELQTSAAESVNVDPFTVTIKHLYTERRMIPLNLYLRDAQPHEAGEAILDYGQAVKDLAATNIFPGDMLLKNFGVTRHGRVVFYDYDELCPLTECSFRDLPAPRDYDDEVSGEPWFYVGPLDIFPEEFLRFLGLTGDLRDLFLAAHADLLTPDYWRRLQDRHRAGEVIDIIPYRPDRRLHEQK